MDWKAFLNTWLPTLQQPSGHINFAQQHQSYRAMMVNVLHLYLIADNWQQQATQAPGCAALFPASSPVLGWMVRLLNKGGGGPSPRPNPCCAEAALNS